MRLGNLVCGIKLKRPGGREFLPDAGRDSALLCRINDKTFFKVHRLGGRMFCMRSTEISNRDGGRDGRDQSA